MSSAVRVSGAPFPRVSLAVIGIAVMAAVVPTPAGWVERIYSHQLYPLAQNTVTRLSSLVGFALFDVVLLLGAAGLSVWWWRSLRRPGRGDRTLGRAVGRQLFRTAVIAAGVYLLFVAVWGLNYRRVPLASKLDYAQSRVTPTALADLAAESVRRVNALYDLARATPWTGLIEFPSVLAPAYERVQQRLGATRTAVAGVPKATMLTAYFQRAGIDGMLNPFSLEVLVNDTVLPFERPFVVAHEWAHLAGYANEAEASFVGWLTCLAGNDQSRYSGWLFLARRLLPAVSPVARADLWAALDDGPQAHIRAIDVRLARTVPVVSRNARRVYDRFLRANRVDAGIASYGLVVDLVLGTDGTPVWRGLASEL